MSDKIIKFIADRPVLKEFWPTPIAAQLPQWWKDMPAYGGFRGTQPNDKQINNEGEYNATIKKCVPILDSLSLGYVLKTDQDIYVKIDPVKDEEGKTTGSTFRTIWRGGITNGKQIEGHPFAQAKEHPLAKQYPNRDVFKYISPWHIVTPPGYSVLFMPPMNNPNGYFQALSGVVDTDMYTNVVNFPFIVEKEEWEGIIPAGTPVVQVFPFKRESWRLETEATEDDLSTLNHQQRVFSTYISAVYRRFFWQKKDFK